MTKYNTTIPKGDDGILLEKAAALFELEMKVGTKLDGHASWIMR